MRKRYPKTDYVFISDDEISELKNNPNIKSIETHRIRFTYEFRCRMYDWYTEHHEIQQFLDNEGISSQIVGTNVIGNLIRNFKKHGHPVNGNKCRLIYQAPKNTQVEIDQLIQTGVFVKGRAHGVRFSESFINEAINQYPSKSVEDLLKEHGIDPDRVGYQRIYLLQRQIEGKVPVPSPTRYSDEDIQKLNACPWVLKVTEKQVRFRDACYNYAYLIREYPIADILEVFDIPAKVLSSSSLLNLRYRILHWVSNDDRAVDLDTQAQIRFFRKLSDHMEKQSEKGITEVIQYLSSDSYSQRREVYEDIRSYVHTHAPMKGFSVSSVCRLFHISRSALYDVRRIHESHRINTDAEDIERIKRVIAYKGYPKGTRMVTMMMPRLEGVTMNRKKVQRLMRKADLLCKVRQPRRSLAAARILLKKNRKKNLLKRGFRLARPFDQVMTDVTYIKDSCGKNVYLSPIKDCASGMILCAPVSAAQDLQLMNRTLDDIPKDVQGMKLLHEGTVFHSDQGALYLNDTFQRKIQSLGFTQSMSRRGNCWDNASMESFFGHLKDEVDFSKCEDSFEVGELISKYVNYYNFDRPQWTRGKKTPVEFALWLQQMPAEEYQTYLSKEKQKYSAMMAKAVEEARIRAVDIGAVLPSKA